MERHFEILENAQRAYDRGDFALARTNAKKLVGDTETPKEVIEKAQKMLKATGIDPMAIVVFAISLAVLVTLVIKYTL